MRRRAFIALALALLATPARAQTCDGPPPEPQAVQQPAPTCEQADPRGLRLSLTPPAVRCPNPPVLIEAVESARCACSDTARAADGRPTRILGDLAALRDPERWVMLSARAQARLATAYLAQNEDAAAAILEDGDPASLGPDFATARALVLAHVGIRNGSADADALVERAAVAARDDATATPDVDFLRAHLAYGRGDLQAARQHATTALALEPTFFAARMLRLRTGLRLYETGSACEASLERVLEDVRALLALAPCPRQAAYVDAALAADPDLDQSRPHVLLVRLALAVLSSVDVAVEARASAIRVARDKGVERGTCAARLQAETEELARARP